MLFLALDNLKSPQFPDEFNGRVALENSMQRGAGQEMIDSNQYMAAPALQSNRFHQKNICFHR